MGDTVVTNMLCTPEVALNIWEGHQTQDRRPLKQQPAEMGVGEKPICEVDNYSTGDPTAGLAYYWKANGCWNSSEPFKAPCSVGDLIYVREACYLDKQMDDVPVNEMSAYEPVGYLGGNIIRTMTCSMVSRGKTRPAIHMPRFASRMTLEVTDVKIQRIQDISDEDCQQEGAFGGHDWDCTTGYPTTANFHPDQTCKCGESSPQEVFSRLWNSLYEKRGSGWDANPWVCAATFTLHKQNVDELLKERAA